MSVATRAGASKASAPTKRTRFDRLDDVLADLVRGRARQLPFTHTCRPTQYGGCSHPPGSLGKRSLLSMLEDMVGDQSGPVKDGNGGGKPSSRKGSPAPWSTQPAELLDQILRGALGLQATARKALGLGPFLVAFEVPQAKVRGPFCEPECVHDSCSMLRSHGRQLPPKFVRVSPNRVALRAAGEQALMGLPGLVRQLDDRDDPLGVTITAKGARGSGSIERDVYAWQAAAETLTGDRVPLQRLPGIPNPDREPRLPLLFGPTCVAHCDHDSCEAVRAARHASRHGRRIGPVCRSCAHGSCDRIRSYRTRLLSWRCPTCGADSLRINWVTDVVTCLRPRCVDEFGERSQWTVADLEAGTRDPWGDELEDQ